MLSSAGHHLPAASRGVFDRLVTVKLRSPEELRITVRDHVHRVASLAQRREFVDLDTARRAAELCLGLLRSWPDLPDPHRHLVQAAVLYFVLDDDAESDLDSPIGFDDDLRVARAVARVIGAIDLLERDQ